MRPDDHKKKKNTAYKKKHGIDGKGTEKAMDKKERPKDKKHQTPAGGDTPSASKTKSSSHQQSHALSDSSSESDDELLYKKKSFKRREIVSNWRKYDRDPDVEESVQARGEDYNKLLSMAGEAMSHFRFQEELEWEQNATSQNGDNPSDFLALDLNDISSSMSCVPIHRVLAIDQSLFPKDVFESHVKDVSKKHSLYLNSVKDRFPVTIRDTQSKSDAVESAQDSSNQPSPSDQSSPGKTHSQSREADSDIHDKLNSKESSDKLPYKNKYSGNKGNSKSQPPATYSSNSSSSSSEEKSQVKLSLGKIAAIHPDTQVSSGIHDDELDQLLDMNVNEKTGASEQRPKAAPVPSAPPTPAKDDKKEAEELEDWLDSILD